MSTIPPDQLTDRQRRAIVRLSMAFARQGAELFLVGGAVRDLLLGRAPLDLDFAVDASPPAIRAAAEEAGATAIHLANERFATVGMQLEGLLLEVTAFRGPAGGGINADLGLRDFTINAMAASLRPDPSAGSGQAPSAPLRGSRAATPIDPFDGQADLRQRAIRGVEDPLARLTEDPLRGLRAARFAAELDFVIEPETEGAVRETAPLLGRVSPERIGAELGRLLLAPGVVTGLHLFARLGLLREAIPELVPLVEFDAEGSKDLWAHTRVVVGKTPPRPVVRWAALLHDIAKPRTYSAQGDEVHFFGHEAIGARMARQVLTRLRLERDLIAGVSTLVELHGRPAQYDPDWTDGGVRRLMLEVGPWLEDLLDLARADVTSGREHVQRRARARIDALSEHCKRILEEQELAKLQSPLDGLQLMALFDRPAGPWIKPVKDHLRNLVIDGLLAPGDVAGATAEAEAWMAEHGEAER